MPPKRARKEDNAAKAIEDMDEGELQAFVKEKEAEVADLTSKLDKARARIVELQSVNPNLSVEDRFLAWNDNGAAKLTKTMSELSNTIINGFLLNALSDGCVNRHETKTADCLLDIISDYAGGELSEKDEQILQFLMDNNIGNVTFE